MHKSLSHQNFLRKIEEIEKTSSDIPFKYGEIRNFNMFDKILRQCEKLRNRTPVKIIMHPRSFQVCKISATKSFRKCFTVSDKAYGIYFYIYEKQNREVVIYLDKKIEVYGIEIW